MANKSECSWCHHKDAIRTQGSLDGFVVWTPSATLSSHSTLSSHPTTPALAPAPVVRLCQPLKVSTHWQGCIMPPMMMPAPILWLRHQCMRPGKRLDDILAKEGVKWAMPYHQVRLESCPMSTVLIDIKVVSVSVSSRVLKSAFKGEKNNRGWHINGSNSPGYKRHLVCMMNKVSCPLLSKAWATPTRTAQRSAQGYVSPLWWCWVMCMRVACQSEAWHCYTSIVPCCTK